MYVSQPEVKPGCVLRRANIGLLEKRKLVTDHEVRCMRQLLPGLAALLLTNHLHIQACSTLPSCCCSSLLACPACSSSSGSKPKHMQVHSSPLPCCRY